MNPVAPANRLTRSLDKLRRTLPTWLHLPAICLVPFARATVLKEKLVLAFRG